MADLNEKIAEMQDLTAQLENVANDLLVAFNDTVQRLKTVKSEIAKELDRAGIKRPRRARAKKGEDSVAAEDFAEEFEDEDVVAAE